jgi:hypothetical protein
MFVEVRLRVVGLTIAIFLWAEASSYNVAHERKAYG